MFALIFIMTGILLAVWAKDALDSHENGNQAVDTAKDKTVDFIDRLFK